MEQLRRRADFLAAASGARVQAGPFVLQGRARDDRGEPRFGLTVTKKTGNAVERNRIRRRLRAAARSIVPQAGLPGFDYVVVARRPVLNVRFDSLLSELERAFGKLHRVRRASAGRHGDADE